MTVPQSPEGSQFNPRNLSSRDVQDVHRNSDVDANFFAQHHTIGLGENQVNPGNHNHDGIKSKALTQYVTNNAPITVTGSRGGNAALASLLTALATKGIIINSTTA